MRRLLVSLPLFALAAAVAVPPDAPQTSATNPPDAVAAAGRAKIAGGLTATVWAAEPLLSNPVAFAFDERGRCFVAETNRMHDGVPDTRSFMHWLDDDIGCRTVADRLRKYQTHKYPDFTKFADQVRVVWDSTGSGRADKSDVFAGGFNAPADGIGSGVLARNGTVYYTCIPDIYALAADPAQSKATGKTSLATGFGVRDQFVGHDLHGLRMGPDGKLYFSIGDRGLNVVNKEGKRLFNPDSGAVLRCDPDGANLEVVHVGLRNPQELAFDDAGNLFTYDNNSDSGDQARWVHIVEGGDSGWRCGYQYGTLLHTAAVPQGNRGPWNTEKIWHVPGPDGGPPAYVVPPLKHFGNGPSGLTHYPGVGLGDQYKDHFFACDFTANAGNSKVWSLAVQPKGAGFEVVDLKPFVENMVPTDCEFGPDGAFYWLDWLGGWNKPGKGRIFRVADPAAMKNPAVAEAQALLAEGFTKKTEAELAKLFGHAHQQVRLEAQYELANPQRKAIANTILAEVARESKARPARLHAIWALGTRARFADPKFTVQPVNVLLSLTTDADAEVRAQVAKTLGAIPGHPGREQVAKLLGDTDPRVRAFAAAAFASAGDAGALPELGLKIRRPYTELAKYGPLFEVLKAADGDAYLRHAAVNALAKMTENPCELLNAWKASGDTFNTPAVRLGVVLALRKLQCRRLGEFLNDPEPAVVAEAARAIYDQDLMTPMADLAKLAEKPNLPDAVAFRAAAANAKLGGTECAARLAAVAARSSEPDHIRAAALKMLAEWAKPPRRDWLTGLTQSLPDRPAAEAKAAVTTKLAGVFAGSDAVRKEAVATVAKLGITEVGPLMAGIVADESQPATTRADALFALAGLKAKELPAATAAAVASPVAKVRAAGRVVKAKANPAAAADELPALLNDAAASPIEKQMALTALGALPESPKVDAALAVWLDKLIAGSAPAELQLDALEAAQSRAASKTKLHAPLREKLKQYDQTVRAAAGDNPTKRYPEALAGGDADKGRELFVNNAAVYCQRCHKLDGVGGEVGPIMNGVAVKKTHEYLLESIVNPNAQIAEGYKSVILNLVDGQTVSGVLRGKDAAKYTLVTPENKVLTVPVADVESEKPDKSAMPDDLHKKLSKRELRDVVAFLAGLTEPGKK